MYIHYQNRTLLGGMGWVFFVFLKVRALTFIGCRVSGFSIRGQSAQQGCEAVSGARRAYCQS
eukprot:6458998-Amphidinium_carterae.1